MLFRSPDSLAGNFPAIVIYLPLRTPQSHKLLGVAEFILDGTSINSEFEELDRTLNRQAFAVFIGAGSVLTTILALAFRALQRSNQLLAQRSQSLLRANRELALAAKTSALGAVTAHLLHGLKNPLSGLQSFIAGHGSASEESGEVDWSGAVATTRRMHALVTETVRVLREHEGGIRGHAPEAVHEVERLPFAGQPRRQGRAGPGEAHGVPTHVRYLELRRPPEPHHPTRENTEALDVPFLRVLEQRLDRKSTRLNSSHRT